jgi:cellulose biosynthesis protein BcsQ
MKVIAIWTIKGGVGKTSTAVNLGHLAARQGLRTLLWDLDPQGAASFYLRIAARLEGGAREVVRKGSRLHQLARATDYPNLVLLPADFSFRHLDLELDARKKPRRRLRRKLEPLTPTTEVVLIDCPPSVSLTSESIACSADVLLVPVIPSTLSLRTLEQVRRFVADVAASPPQLLPFLSMVDRRKRLHREVCDHFGGGADGFLETTIPFASLVERMGLTRAPVTATHPAAPPARAFADLWHEVWQRVGDSSYS